MSSYSVLPTSGDEFEVVDDATGHTLAVRPSRASAQAIATNMNGHNGDVTYIIGPKASYHARNAREDTAPIEWIDPLDDPELAGLTSED